MPRIDWLTIHQGLERLLPSDALEAYTKAQPLGRFGHVRDIADATVYLFSDTGSYVSGQTLVGELSDNKRTLWMLRTDTQIVDGANWRMSAGGASGGSLSYPDFLLSGDEVPNVTGKKSKLWANETMYETVTLYRGSSDPCISGKTYGVTTLDLVDRDYVHLWYL